MAIALDPSICTRSSRHHVEVECAGTFTRGMTVVDELGVTAADTENVAAWRPLTRGREPNVKVCWQIDVERWKGLLRRLVQ
jgi:inosine-uridine nucleoside N-ribohydrolase